MNLSWSQLSWAAAAAGSKKKIPPLKAFVPEPPSDDAPERPSDFSSWAALLLPLGR